MFKHQYRQFAFTLIELLVVIAIIGLLLSIVVPVFGRVKERSKRVVCQSHIRSFYIAITAYAGENDYYLPQGGAPIKADDYEYTFLLQKEVCESLVGNGYEILVCPNLFKPFRGGGVNAFEQGSDDIGIGANLIGYNYLGGFEGTPWELTDPADAEWVSPRRITEKGSVPIITELNSWMDGEYNMTFAPHGYRGAIHEAGDSTNEVFNGIPSSEIGAVGGHLGFLDGSIKWKDIEDMHVYRGSLDPDWDLYVSW